jgi:lipoprotein-releasing system ATP-binding protein
VNCTRLARGVPYSLLRRRTLRRKFAAGVINLPHEGPPLTVSSQLERDLRPKGLHAHPTSVSAPLLQVDGLSKVFAAPHGPIQLFRDLHLALAPGELTSIVGQSGTGKSTLLHLLGALDKPTSGDVRFQDQRLNAMSADQAADFRNTQLGFVWQFHYLLPEFSALENVAMPLLARGMSHAKANAEAAYWLNEVHLSDRAEHRPGELSGGEQQRVALARALVTRPKLLLADEPTGDLDNQTAALVFNLIEELHRAHGLTSLIVTHDELFASRCNRMLRLQDGKLLEVPLAGKRQAEPLMQVQH